MCTRFAGTQMCVTPNYLVDENWNKSNVIDVKAFFQPCKKGGEKGEGKSISSNQVQIRSGTIHKLLYTHFSVS